MVPMAGQTTASIEHLLVDQIIKTLGVMNCPSGAHKGALQRKERRAQEWLDLVKNGKILRRHV